MYTQNHFYIFLLFYYFLIILTKKKEKRNKNMSIEITRNLSYFVFSGNYMTWHSSAEFKGLYFLSYTVYLVNRRNPTYNLCCKPFQNL